MAPSHRGVQMARLLVIAVAWLGIVLTVHAEEVRYTIKEVDVGARRFFAEGRWITVGKIAKISDASGNPLRFEELRMGDRVESTDGSEVQFVIRLRPERSKK